MDPGAMALDLIRTSHENRQALPKLRSTNRPGCIVDLPLARGCTGVVVRLKGEIVGNNRVADTRSGVVRQLRGPQRPSSSSCYSLDVPKVSMGRTMQKIVSEGRPNAAHGETKVILVVHLDGPDAKRSRS